MIYSISLLSFRRENMEELMIWYVTVIYSNGHYAHQVYGSFDGKTYGLLSSCYFRTPGDISPYHSYIIVTEVAEWVLHPEVNLDYNMVDEASKVVVSDWDEALEKGDHIDFDKPLGQEEDGIFPSVVEFFEYRGGRNWKQFWYQHQALIGAKPILKPKEGRNWKRIFTFGLLN